MHSSHFIHISSRNAEYLCDATRTLGAQLFAFAGLVKDRHSHQCDSARIFQCLFSTARTASDECLQIKAGFSSCTVHIISRINSITSGALIYARRMKKSNAPQRLSILFHSPRTGSCLVVSCVSGKWNRCARYATHHIEHALNTCWVTKQTTMQRKKENKYDDAMSLSNAQCALPAISFRDTRRMLSSKSIIIWNEKLLCTDCGAIRQRKWHLILEISEFSRNWRETDNFHPYGRRLVAFISFRHANVRHRSSRARRELSRVESVHCEKWRICVYDYRAAVEHAIGHWHFRRERKFSSSHLRIARHIVVIRQELYKWSPFPLSNWRRKVVAILHLFAVCCARAQILFIARINSACEFMHTLTKCEAD